ncbi:hypothetical protein NC652_006336 [Populus alba x Populus x berolinensis]|nr:hypothetical protein NC652_006336 [Populus alba x Populus x berolinensis]
METGFHDDVRSIITRSPTLSLFSLFVSLLANMPLQGPNQLHELSSTLSLCVLTCTVSISYDGTWEPEPEPASVTKDRVHSVLMATFPCSSRGSVHFHVPFLYD